jgi:hypothetical protein
VKVRRDIVGDEIHTYVLVVFPDGSEEWVLMRIDPDRFERLQHLTFERGKGP